MTGPYNPLAFPIVLRTPDWLPPDTPADGRLPMAMLVVGMLEPAQVVELGVGRGDTYAALCQAVQELRLASQCLGVELDGAASATAVEPETSSEFRSFHAARYGGFSRLVGGDAQGSAEYFSDRSVALLHLAAGLNSAEAAAAFRCWLPKLSARGAVLVSNINPTANGESLASFWSETKQEYPHFELHQGQGLGLLLVGVERPEGLAQLTQLPAEERVALRELLYRLGQAAASNSRQADGALQAQIRSLEGRLAEKDSTGRANEAETASLKQTLREQTEHMDKLQGRLDLVMAREREMRGLYLDLHQQLLHRDQPAAQAAEKDQIIVARDEAIAWLQAELALAQRTDANAEKDRIIAARDEAIARLQAELAQHNRANAEKDRIIAERDEAIAWLQAELAQRTDANAESDRIIAARDEGITWLRAELALAQAETRTVRATRTWRLATAAWRVRARFASLFRGSSASAH